MGNGNDSIKTPIILQYFSQFKPVHFKKGEVIERPDLPNLSVFYIETGCIKKYAITKDGEEKIIMFYKNHDLFPMFKSFQNTSSHLYAEAVIDSSIRSTTENDFKVFLKSNPKAMEEFMDYLLTHVEKSYQRIDNLGFITSRPKVIYRLLNLAESFGKLEDNKITIDLELTQKDIANTTAMTRETVGREIEKLTKEGLINCKNKRIEINDINKLVKKMDSYEELKWQFS